MINAGTEFAGNHVFMTTKIDFSKDEIDKIQKNIKHFNNTLKETEKYMILFHLVRIICIISQ